MRLHDDHPTTRTPIPGRVESGPDLAGIAPESVYIPGIGPPTVPLTFERDGVTCGVVPVALATGAYGEINPEIFLAAFYLHAHYRLGAESDGFPDAVPFNEPRLRDHILTRYLGQQTIAVDLGPGLISAARSQLARGAPVLVQVERSMLEQCASGYHGRPGRHLLLLKGFRRGLLDVFVVQDNQHVEPVANGRFLGTDPPRLVDVLDEPMVTLRAMAHSRTVALKSLLGEMYVEGFYPAILVESAHDGFLRRARSTPGYHLEDVSVLALERVASGQWPDATAALAGLREAMWPVSADVEAVVLRKVAFTGRGGDPRAALAYVSSQRAFVAATAVLAERAGVDQGRVAEFRKAGVAVAQAWTRHTILRAVTTAQTGATPADQPDEEILQLERRLIDQLHQLH
ncbi:hypothetical protein ACQPYA_19285 [Micromonospora sp. CA-263727]|uniref:hypothetical protein n=1 Tax=Micromonospora sp. CA-263727 TaxID=3239967 RepID=UPI003D8B1B46